MKLKQTRQYLVEGALLEIPIRFDEMAGIYIEEYPDFTETPVWTPMGHPVMFAGEDACSLAKEAEAGGCPDCGSCRYYRSAASHTWFGVCLHEEKNKLHTLDTEEEQT